MKKILFYLKETQPTNGDKRHGGGKYGEIVLKRIMERGLPISCCYDSSVWFNPELHELIDKKGIDLYDLSKEGISDIVRKDISFVFVPANLNGYYWRSINCNVLGVIHGVRGLETPLDNFEFLYKQPLKVVIKSIVKRFSKRLRRSRQRAYILSSLNAPNIKFVTVSNHSAFAFKSYFPELDLDIPVFYSPSTSVIETATRKYQEKYFLLVSANRTVKNNLRAIIALDNLFSNGYAEGFRVKVTGINSSRAFWYKIKNRERFDFIGYIDEQELDQLYHDAYCFIYPTLNEGFGYPPLEAMHYGVPVLSSPFTAIPEVCGGNVIYFNPFSVEEIMNRILMILQDDIHKKYSLYAKERYEIITQKQNEDLDRLIDFLYSTKF